jgi:hypothetical protein
LANRVLTVSLDLRREIFDLRLDITKPKPVVDG